ncbi:DUF2922 family protein [Fibrobacter sp.]|uniref:DUF2922 family protein n=1 Tax=Fibrobacter sp. TaxID=35828 RepID=UPI0025BC00BE|nr:DUF2922 family protein [Fibrobacter sp.]MBR4008886.1 DUF2922 family protein [Fibrobacter sp.]
MAKVLKLVFSEDNNNKNRTITLQNPVNGLTAEQVHGATDKMIAKQAIMIGNYPADALEKMYYEETIKTEIA